MVSGQKIGLGAVRCGDRHRREAGPSLVRPFASADKLGMTKTVASFMFQVSGVGKQ